MRKQEPCYRREDRAMPLYISIRIEFYNGIVRFVCHSTHLKLILVCRLQLIICQQLTNTRKNQSDRIVNAEVITQSLSITAVIIIYLQRSLIVTINRTRRGPKDSCENAHVCYCPW